MHFYVLISIKNAKEWNLNRKFHLLNIRLNAVYIYIYISILHYIYICILYALRVFLQLRNFHKYIKMPSLLLTKRRRNVDEIFYQRLYIFLHERIKYTLGYRVRLIIGE